MSENFGNHLGIFNRGDDLHSTTTVGAVVYIDIDHAFTKTFPGFRPSGRQLPFKTALGGFVSSPAQLMCAEAV